MKNYELNNRANQFQANVAVEEKTFMDFYKDVRDCKIVPVTDEQDNIIGFNVVKAEPSSMKVCKMVGGTMTVGDTEEQRAADEVAMRKFTQEYPVYNVQKWFLASMTLVKANMEPDDIVDVDDDIYIILADAKKVIDLDGQTVVDLSNDEDLEGASKKVIIKLLKAAINAEF